MRKIIADRVGIDRSLKAGRRQAAALHMFTGIIETIGKLETLERDGRVTVAVEEPTFLCGSKIGDSISVNGVCLSIVELADITFHVDVVEETRRKSTLGKLASGSSVNLERALLATSRLDGHVVQGHVDGVGTILTVRDEGGGWWVTIEPPSRLMRYIAEKGSIAIDGISLTVANVAYSNFSVAVIPHTREVTTAGSWQQGREVNLETDVLAKYVERQLIFHKETNTEL